MYTITISTDPSPALDSMLQLAEAPLEIVKRALNAIESGTQLFCLDVDGLSTAGTSDLRILFKPSDFLLELMPTARTR